MDMREQLREARSRMLAAQCALDEYLRSGQSNKAEFDSLFETSQNAHSQYAMMLREYMDQKYAYLKDPSGLGITFF